MKRIIQIVGFSLFSILSFGVAFYGINYIFQAANPKDTFQIKMLTSGLIPPVHFLSGGLALALIPFQLSHILRLKIKSLHRILGVLYVLFVTIGSLTGLVMALKATGGWLAQWGFLNLAIIWLITTHFAFYYAVKGNFVQHRRWIYRSVAITAAAITFRLFLGIGVAVMQLPFLTVYVPSAWLCWITNLAISEYFLYRHAHCRNNATNSFA